MDKLNNLLNIKLSKLIVNKKTIKKTRARNFAWEEAEWFASSLGIKTPFVYGLFKLHGRERVMGIYTWLKDLPKVDNLYSLIVWKLKNLDK